MTDIQKEIFKEMIFTEFEESDIVIGLYTIKPEEVIFHCYHNKSSFQVIIDLESDKHTFILCPIFYGNIVETRSLDIITDVINNIYEISNLIDKGEY